MNKDLGRQNNYNHHNNNNNNNVHNSSHNNNKNTTSDSNNYQHTSMVASSIETFSQTLTCTPTTTTTFNSPPQLNTNVTTGRKMEALTPSVNTCTTHSPQSTLTSPLPSDEKRQQREYENGEAFQFSQLPFSSKHQQISTTSVHFGEKYVVSETSPRLCNSADVELGEHLSKVKSSTTKDTVHQPLRGSPEVPQRNVPLHLKVVETELNSMGKRSPLMRIEDLSANNKLQPHEEVTERYPPNQETSQETSVQVQKQIQQQQQQQQQHEEEEEDKCTRVSQQEEKEQKTRIRGKIEITRDSDSYLHTNLNSISKTKKSQKFLFQKPQRFPSAFQIAAEQKFSPDKSPDSLADTSKSLISMPSSQTNSWNITPGLSHPSSLSSPPSPFYKLSSSSAPWETAKNKVPTESSFSPSPYNYHHPQHHLQQHQQHLQHLQHSHYYDPHHQRSHHYHHHHHHHHQQQQKQNLNHQSQYLRYPGPNLHKHSENHEERPPKYFSPFMDRYCTTTNAIPKGSQEKMNTKQYIQASRKEGNHYTHDDDDDGGSHCDIEDKQEILIPSPHRLHNSLPGLHSSHRPASAASTAVYINRSHQAIPPSSSPPSSPSSPSLPSLSSLSSPPSHYFQSSSSSNAANIQQRHYHDDPNMHHIRHQNYQNYSPMSKAYHSHGQYHSHPRDYYVPPHHYHKQEQQEEFPQQTEEEQEIPSPYINRYPQKFQHIGFHYHHHHEQKQNNYHTQQPYQQHHSHVFQQYLKDRENKNQDIHDRSNGVFSPQGRDQHALISKEYEKRINLTPVKDQQSFQKDTKQMDTREEIQRSDTMKENQDTSGMSTQNKRANGFKFLNQDINSLQPLKGEKSHVEISDDEKEVGEDGSYLSSSSSNEADESPSERRKSRKRHINCGKWSDEEHQQFLAGLQSHGNKWRIIAQKYVKTRTRTQVASHAQSYFLKLKNQGGCGGTP